MDTDESFKIGMTIVASFFSRYSMKYDGEFEACKITCTMLMLYFKRFPGNSA